MPQKHRVTFAIGQGFDKNGIELYALNTKRTAVLAKTAREFGGFSAVDAQGGWIAGKGKLVTEPSLIITVYTDKVFDACEIHAQRLAELFNQESVMLTVEPVISIDFVGQ